MRVGLLECDRVMPALLPIAGEYRDMFRALLERDDPGVELVPHDVRSDGPPSDPDACEGWICTGSSASVYDDEPWIHHLSGFVRSVHQAGVPYVGICFGHQLLAHALGGRTERAAGGWGVGAHDMALHAAPGWPGVVPSGVRLLYVHQDQVAALPSGGAVLGSAAHCPVAALAVGDTMLGIQGHPEFTAAYVDALVAGRVDRVGAARAAAARASLEPPRDEPAVARWMVEFLRAGRR